MQKLTYRLQNNTPVCYRVFERCLVLQTVVKDAAVNFYPPQLNITNSRRNKNKSSELKT